MLTSLITSSQTTNFQQKPRLSFEVASIKPLDITKITRGHEGHQLDRERFVDRTELLQFIVRAYLGGTSCVMTATPAFGWSCPLISGSLPAWLTTERYEIQAKIPADSIPNYTARQLHFEDTPELNAMLQGLLEDRLHLRVHWVTKELPVYALVIGKNGPKLKKTPLGGDVTKAADGSMIEIHGSKGISSVPTSDGSLRTKLEFQASSMQDAAMTFSFYFDRQVLDRTGLKGDYDFSIEYEDDPSLRNSLRIFSGLTPSALSTALQTVGLKLESTKAQLSVLVIDHVEKPTEN
jgi:uncharacterized protein (TIGR03435 family)